MFSFLSRDAGRRRQGRGRCIAELVDRYCERCFICFNTFLNRLIFIIRTQQKSGRSLSKLGRITRLPYEVALETQSRAGSNIAYVIGAKARKVFATFTDWAGDTDQIHPVLQKFAAFWQPLKKVPFERYKLILECKNPESLTIIVGQLFGSSQKDANLNRLPRIRFYGTSSCLEF